MAAKSTKKKVSASSSKSCCSCSCCNDNNHAHLPGSLLIGLGLVTLPLNFGLIPGLEFAKAWPLLMVLFGFVLIVKEPLSKHFGAA